MWPITTTEDRKRAIQVLSACFGEVPGVSHLIHRKNRDRAVRAICNYCLAQGLDDGLAYLSGHGKGVALLTRNPAPFRFRNYLRMASIVWNATGICGALDAWRFMNEKVRYRSKEQGLYFLMLAALPAPNGLSPVVDLKDTIFALADRSGEPILLEATVSKNMLVYRRYGFETYQYLEPTTKRPFPIWYMRRAPQAQAV